MLESEQKEEEVIINHHTPSPVKSPTRKLKSSTVKQVVAASASQAGTLGFGVFGGPDDLSSDDEQENFQEKYEENLE